MTEKRKLGQLQIASEDYLLLSHSSSGFCFDEKSQLYSKLFPPQNCFSLKTNQFTFQQILSSITASSGFAATCLWHLLCAKLFFIFQKIYKSTITSHIKLERIGAQYFHFSASALEFIILPGKSDIMKVTGFITASDRYRKLI